MIVHWLTMAWRSLIASPLFSAITIVSLSIGCCGALLAGANILQHVSFDRWIPNGDRIVVITRKQDPATAFPATASIRIEGPGMSRPNMLVVPPMRDAIEGKIPGMAAQARMMRMSPLLQEDQDEQDRRQAAGPPPPGEAPRPFTGTVYVDPEFFQVFELEMLEGAADQLEEPDRILLTESRAKRLFGNQSAVGQTVAGVKGRSLIVVGVLRDLPAATHLTFESVASVRTLQAIQAAEEAERKAAEAQQGPSAPGGPTVFINRPSMSSWRNAYGGIHYLRMAADADPEAFIAAATREIQAAGDQGAKQVEVPAGAPPGFRPSAGPSFQYSVVPMLDLHLGGPELSGMQSTGDITMLTTLGLAAFALLGVSAFNYVTLSLARALRRRREVAVRKVLGGSQGDLVRQYLVESAVVTAISLLLGFVLAQFLHPWFARAIGQPETLFNLFDPAFLAWSLAGFVVVAAAVGAYPAFYLSAVRPRTALGEGGVAAPGRIGQFVTASLLGLQISAATGLLIVAATMGAQANYIETRPMGFDMKNRYQLNANCPLDTRMTGQQLGTLLQKCQTAARDLVKKTPGIDKAFYFGGQLLTENIQTQGFGRSSAGEEIGRAAQLSVDTDFLQGMGATLLAGRLFDSTSAYDRQLIDQAAAFQAARERPPGSPPPQMPKIEKVPIVVTRAALTMLGADTPEAAIGQQIYRKPNSQYSFEVIGVVEDWQQRPLKYAVHPIVFVPSNAQSAVLEIAPGKVEDVRAALNAAWRDLLGDQKVSVSLQSMSDMQERVYQTDYRLMRAVSSFAFVAIIVAGLGVFGLSAFEMRRRVREIGIRKALGASPYMVGAMVIGRQVAFAAAVSLIAWPIGFYIGSQWLTGFVYRTQLGWFVPPLATLIVIAFVALAVGLSSARAAAMRPGAALNG